jgi:hypothetical protein
MSRTQQAFLWAVVVLTAPLWLVALLAMVVWRCARVVALYALVWSWWLGRARRRALFVYSDSPNWKDYVEANIIPEAPSEHGSVELVRACAVADVESAGDVV